MALVFPSNPSVGQTHTDGTRSWRWTGARWQSVQASPLSHAATHATGGSDALTPTDIGAAASVHTHTIANVTGLQTALDGKQAAGSYAPASGISPTAITGTAVVTNDSRLSDARTPTSHKSSHATGGSDALTPADIGAATTAQGTKADSALQPSALTSYRTASAQDTIDTGKAASSHTHPLSQLQQSSATNGQVPVWNGTAWVPQTPASGGVTSYNNLTDKPTLGTAAATQSTDYATAAQGAKADSALQANALAPYRTSAAQDTIDAGKATLQGADPDSSASVIIPLNNGAILTVSGTLNGKNFYQWYDDSNGDDIYWDGTRWVLHDYYRGDGDTDAYYYATGNTTYPWLATWTGVTVTRKAVNDTQPLNTNSSAGVSTTASRSDHVHALPTPAQIGAEPAFSALPITKGGTGATTAAQARTNLGVAGASTTIQVFASSGTWTKPTGAKIVDIQCVGGGGGGGAGTKVAASTAVYGGLGGSSGGCSRITIDASQLSDNSYTITVGAGGSGAIYNGAAAGTPTSTTVVGATDGRIAGVNVGGVAPNGGTSLPTNTYAGIPMGNLSGASSITAAAGNAGINNFSPQSGAAGGGCSTSAAFAGGASTNPFTGASAGGGANTGANGTAVTAKTQSSLIFNGTGGSGGGGSITSSGGTGGNATGYGCGGGGGGSCSNISGIMVGGNGGNGKSGVVVITTYF